MRTTRTASTRGGAWRTAARAEGRAPESAAAGASNNLYGIYPASPSHVRAVGQSGAHYFFDGGSWQPVASGSNDLNWVGGSGPSDVWYVGELRITRHYQPATDFVSRDFPLSGPIDLRAAASLGPGEIIALGTSRQAYHHYPDGGAQAEDPLTDPLDGGAAPYMLGAWAFSPSDVWAVGLRGTVRHRTGGGWAVVDAGFTGHLYAIHGAAPDELWAAGEGTELLHHKDGVWTRRQVSASSGRFNSVWASSRDDVWFGGQNELIHWDGCRFGVVPSPVSSGEIYSIHGLTPLDVWAGTQGGKIFRYSP